MARASIHGARRWVRGCPIDPANLERETVGDRHHLRAALSSGANGVDQFAQNGLGWFRFLADCRYPFTPVVFDRK